MWSGTEICGAAPGDTTGAEIRAPMPVVDDEYPQLAAALNAALASDGITFVAIELGAWWVLLPQSSVP